MQLRNDSLFKWKLTGLIATVSIILSLPLYMAVEKGRAPLPKSLKSHDEAAFTGSQACQGCHKQQYDDWMGSFHERAMDTATDKSVLGDFNNTETTHLGTVTRFFRKDGKYYVYTTGLKGEMGEFEITHTFGTFPLQQYLVPFPGGRLQCLPFAWDVREKRWFHLYPDETIDPGEWLYWTNAGQNWNGMCAECHSTNLKKNYNPKMDNYETSWSEISVGCEACHGPGSRHVAWAQLPDMARPQGIENFELSVKTRNTDARSQVERCAPCHSRRAIIGDYTHNETDLLDSLLPTLINEGLYYPDGQILDEVFVYGSFTQSKMYHRKVRCSDCHNVHSTKTIKKGNDLCLQCHRAAQYDTSEHHFHKRFGEPGEPVKDKNGKVLFEVGSGAQCVQCHMPGRIYMGVDYRSDHSIRIPRPDLSLQLDTPNACNRCHKDRSVKWTEQVMAKWYGPGRPIHYGSIIAAGRRGVMEIRAELLKLAGDHLYPVIVRSTAIDLLSKYPGMDTRHILEQAMYDSEALIRRTAISRSELLSPDRRQQLLTAMIYDPVMAVRMEAAFQLSGIPGLKLPPYHEDAFRSALQEYRKAMNYSADFAFGRFNLGNLLSNLNQPDAAIEQYREAIRIDNQFIMAKVNLALLYNQKGNRIEAEKLLRGVLAARSDFFEVHYYLGLLLAEGKRHKEAASHLQIAAKGMPNFARVHYNLGKILNFLKDSDNAQISLEHALILEPFNPDYLKAVVQHYQQFNKYSEAQTLARRILVDHPDSPVAKDLLIFLEKGVKNTIP